MVLGAREPQIVVLDEAFNGLDPASSLVLKRHLRERVRKATAHEWRREEIAAFASSSSGGFETAIAAISG